MRISRANPVPAVHDLERSSAWCIEPGEWTFCRCGEVSFMLGRRLE